jgi:nucleotide-binding universal stress UspA family protein
MLVAVNPDPFAPEDHALALELLGSAARIASITGTELHVLHAWKLFGERWPDADAAADPELAPLLGATLNRHAGYLEAALEATELAALPLRRHLVHDRASRAIIDVVRREGIELLVMGTVGRTGIPGFFIGNTAETVLAEVDCAVLAQKPAAFRSPLLA